MTSPLPETLVRSIDLTYPSNRYAVGGALGTVVFSLLTGRSWGTAGRAGALAFLAWAIARELDPDHPESAGVALPLAGVLAWMDGKRTPLEDGVDVLGAGAALAGLRFVTGSVGAIPDRTDDAALIGAAALSALTGQRGAALVPALAPLAVRVNRGEEGGNELLCAVTALLPALVPAQRAGTLSRLSALAALALAARAAAPEEVDAPTDQGRGKVSSERVQAARVMAQGAAALSALGGHGSAAGVLASVNLAVGMRRSRT